MNQSAAKALRYLTKQKDPNSVSVKQLQDIVNEYPYFPVTQFLLAQKLKSENSNDFEAQSQKAALYYSNPLLLDYQLNQDENFILDDQDELLEEIEEINPEILGTNNQVENTSINTI